MSARRVRMRWGSGRVLCLSCMISARTSFPRCSMACTCEGRARVGRFRVSFDGCIGLSLFPIVSFAAQAIASNTVSVQLLSRFLWWGGRGLGSSGECSGWQSGDVFLGGEGPPRIWLCSAGLGVCGRYTRDVGCPGSSSGALGRGRPLVSGGL
jgi:hypothetical protein